MKNSEWKPIGLIGLGLVGCAVARRLLGAGYAVRGYDIAEGARAHAKEMGVEVLPDARAVGSSTKTLILSLPTSENRRALCWGEQRLAEALQCDTVILDTTTGRPEDIEEDSRRLGGMGAKLVDVCLVGSSQVIAEGRAVALVGDVRESASYADVLAIFSKAQYFLGAPGQGSRVKLVVNLVLGLNRLALAEGLGLADRAGFDLGMVLDILKVGDTYSVVMDAKGAKMVSGVYEPPVARLAQHAKDVHLILDYARQLGASLPVTETHARIIDDLVLSGHGELDNAAVFKAYRP